MFFNLGFSHITDIKGYDHIIFLLALCSIYTIKQWRLVLVLVTSFTIGHSITLALSVFNLIKINSNVIEILIPVTIIVTSILNIVNKKRINKRLIIIKYFAALFFGLIHGLGFSNYLKSLLGSDSIIIELFAFNIGLELGQILIVITVLLISYLLVRLLHFDKRELNLLLSGAAIGISVILILERSF